MTGKPVPFLPERIAPESSLFGDAARGKPDPSMVLNYRQEAIYKREAFDWYIEAASDVHKLFDAVTFEGAIHDPACGAGNIPTVARSRDYTATGSDMVDRGFCVGGTDFLQDLTPRVNIVSNPPYVLAKRFALHALKMATHRVALLVRLAFLEGQDRRKTLYLPHPPERVLIFATRPSMPPGGTSIKATGGKVAYAWIVWNNAASAEPTVGWLP